VTEPFRDDPSYLTELPPELQAMRRAAARRRRWRRRLIVAVVIAVAAAVIALALATLLGGSPVSIHANHAIPPPVADPSSSAA
jgi:fatty acid desaturase